MIDPGTILETFWNIILSPTFDYRSPGPYIKSTHFTGQTSRVSPVGEE